MKYLPLFSLTIIACNTDSDSENLDTSLIGDSAQPAWNPAPQTFSNESSTENSISWTPATDEGYEIHHYEIGSTELSSGKESTIIIESTETEYTFTGLKSDSEYEYFITACLNEVCSKTAEIYRNENDIENNYWLVKTAPERWEFTQNSSRTNFQVAFLNGKNPSILVFENTADSDGQILLSYTDTNTGNVHFGNVDLSLDNPETSLVVSSGMGQGIFRDSSISQFTRSHFKPFLQDNELQMMMFFSFESVDQSTQIGFLSNTEGLEIDFGGECTPSNGMNCLMQTCLSSEEEAIEMISTFHVAWESFNLDNMGAKEEPILIIGGQQTSQDEGSIFYATIVDGTCSLYSDENNYPQKWIQNAKHPAVLNYNTAQSKLYYQSALNNSLYLLYWHATITGEENIYDFDDLENADLARKIELVDSDGNILPSDMVDNIGSYHLFRTPIDQQQYMMYTILENNTPIGLGLAHLSNP